MRGRGSFLMGRRFLTAHASSMAELCIAPLSASSRIGYSLSSKLRGDCSWTLICIAFVPPLHWDCTLTYSPFEEVKYKVVEHKLLLPS